MKHSYTPAPRASSDIMHVAANTGLHYIAEVNGRSNLLGDVGHRVRALREARGLTQRALADRSGVSPRYLAQLEAGDANISVERLADVCRVLGSSPSAILDGQEASGGADPL